MPLKKLLIIVPVYNEEKTLGTSVPKLVEFFKKNPFPNVNIQIAIAGRQSKDNTNAIASKLEKKYTNVTFSEIDHPEKCGRIGKINQNTDYDFYAFIDSDLPISLKEFHKIIKPVVAAKADIAIASKYIRGAGQNRDVNRVIFSKTYNMLIRLLLPKIKVHDTQAGAKAWNKKVAKEIIPKIGTPGYFFDAELLYFCFDQHFKVAEIPVHYMDRRKDSKVGVLRESWVMGKELLRFSLGRWFS